LAQEIMSSSPQGNATASSGRSRNSQRSGSPSISSKRLSKANGGFRWRIRDDRFDSRFLFGERCSRPANPSSISFDLDLRVALSAFCRGIANPKGRRLDKHSKIWQALVDATRNDATLIVPGAHDPISAKLIERHRFPAVYVGSYATSAGWASLTWDLSR
jgi:hypothetical protein